MVKFLNTPGITAAIDEIIREAENEITLISPFLDIPRVLLQNLQSACTRGVGITLIYGNKQGSDNKEDLKDEIKGQLSQLSTLKLRYLDNLHAKCYFNERNMVISSMNLYDYSAHQNREMGILINATDDQQVFANALREANDIKERSISKSIKKNVLMDGLKGLAKALDAEIQGDEGYCIRCRTRIPLDEAQPLCHDCWEKWNNYKDSSYKEKYCHVCGKTAPTSKAKPECSSCYRSR